MVAFFGPSEQDRERLRATVQSLGTTSVPGLAAALSWRERKAEKLLAQELARPNTPLVYEPARRVVRWARAPPTVAPAREAPMVRPRVVDLPARAPRAPAPVLTGTTLKTLCPSCHVPLIPTGSSSLAVCPQCGRLASSRGGDAEGAAAPGAGNAKDIPDRRSQELFAAYVSSKPMQCPKCRTPLRHRGLSEYTCPNCAQTVKFPKAVEIAAPAPAPPSGPA